MNIKQTGVFGIGVVSEGATINGSVVSGVIINSSFTHELAEHEFIIRFPMNNNVHQMLIVSLSETHLFDVDDLARVQYHELGGLAYLTLFTNAKFIRLDVPAGSESLASAIKLIKTINSKRSNRKLNLEILD